VVLIRTLTIAGPDIQGHTRATPSGQEQVQGRNAPVRRQHNKYRVLTCAQVGACTSRHKVVVLLRSLTLALPLG
jgi:hypothetical protein